MVHLLIPMGIRILKYKFWENTNRSQHLVKFIPKEFIVFGAIVNKIIFLISCSDIHNQCIDIQLIFVYLSCILQPCGNYLLALIVFQWIPEIEIVVLLSFQSWCILLVFVAYLYWLEPPVQCQTELLRADIPILFLMMGESIQSYIVKYDGAVGFFALSGSFYLLLVC